MQPYQQTFSSFNQKVLHLKKRYGQKTNKFKTASLMILLPEMDELTKLRICSHLLKKSLMENFIFCAVKAIKCRWRSRRSKRNGIILDRKTTIIDARLLIIEHMYMDVLGCHLKSFLRQSYFRRGNKQREVRYQSRYQNSMNIAFFISSAGEKPDKPILIW